MIQEYLSKRACENILYHKNLQVASTILKLVLPSLLLDTRYPAIPVSSKLSRKNRRALADNVIPAPSEGAQFRKMSAGDNIIFDML
jgi:hypothetical protein